MIAEVRDAVLQVLLLVRLHFRGWGLLQFAQNPLCRMMLVLEIMTLFIKPLFTFLFVLENRRRSARQVLTGVVEIQDLLINVGAKKIPGDANGLPFDDQIEELHRIGIGNFFETDAERANGIFVGGGPGRPQATHHAQQGAKQHKCPKHRGT